MNGLTGGLLCTMRNVPSPAVDKTRLELDHESPQTIRWLNIGKTQVGSQLAEVDEEDFGTSPRNTDSNFKVWPNFTKAS